MFIVMGKDRVEVASAFLSEDKKSVSGFREDGSRVILLEGVNGLRMNKGNELNFKSNRTQTKNLQT